MQLGECEELDIPTKNGREELGHARRVPRAMSNRVAQSFAILEAVTAS